MWNVTVVTLGLSLRLNSIFVFVLPGIFLSLSPQHVLGHDSIIIPSGIKGELFCRLVVFCVWLCAKFSIAIVTCMAIERWYAIARPMQYKIVFTRIRVLRYVSIIFLSSLLVNALVPLEVRLQQNGSENWCVFDPLIKSKVGGQIWTLVYCLVTVFVPFSLIIATYIHIRIVLQRQAQSRQRRPNTFDRRHHLEIQLCRMSAIVAVFLGVCFIPNQISFILYKFDIGYLDSPEHLATIVLSMVNSFINPWIYCFSNKNYRREFRRLLCPCSTQAQSVDVSGTSETRPTTSGGKFELR